MKISNEAMQSVSQKLNEFAAGLDEDERALVDLLLAKAFDEDEVTGFNFGQIRPVGIGRPQFQAPKFEAQIGNLFSGPFNGPCPDGFGWCRETIGDDDAMPRFF